MLEKLQNRPATRKESGQYNHVMGLRNAMSPPQSVWKLAEEEDVSFKIGSAEMGVLTQQGFFVPKTPKNVAMETVHYRTDTMTVLTSHPGTYTLRADGYGPIFEEAEKMFGETCTMVRSLDGGLRVYMLFQPDEPVDFGGGQMVPTVGLSASLNSSIATSMHAFAFDPFCTNAFTSRTAIMRTKATTNHDVFFRGRMELLAKSINETKALARIARIASDQEFTDSQFQELVASLPTVEKRRWAAQDKWDRERMEFVPAHGTSVKNYEFTIDSINDEWDMDKSRFGETKWTAFSAIQGAEQHHLNGGINGSKADKAERVLRKGLFDPHHTLAEEAWRALRLEELVSA
jgi:hypothetical protein